MPVCKEAAIYLVYFSKKFKICFSFFIFRFSFGEFCFRLSCFIFRHSGWGPQKAIFWHSSGCRIYQVLTLQLSPHISSLECQNAILFFVFRVSFFAFSTFGRISSSECTNAILTFDRCRISSSDIFVEPEYIKSWMSKCYSVFRFSFSDTLTQADYQVLNVKMLLLHSSRCRISSSDTPAESEYIKSRMSKCYLSRLMTKPTKWYVHPAKTQLSLSICPDWSESSLCAQWVAKDPAFLNADSEDSDQIGRMPRLIWVFAGRKVHFVGFLLLKFCYEYDV